MKIVKESLNEFKKIDKSTYADLGLGIYKNIKPEHREAAKWFNDIILSKMQKDETTSDDNIENYYVKGHSKYKYVIERRPKEHANFINYDENIYKYIIRKFNIDYDQQRDFIKTLLGNIFDWYPHQVYGLSDLGSYKK